jgi:hypothetical protein
VVLVHWERSQGGALSSASARGISLAIDLRGHGGARSREVDLARACKRDVKLFAEMHKDAFAAVARDGKCDPKRIALVGASVRVLDCIDGAAVLDVAAVLCMSPANYLGLIPYASEDAPASVPLPLLVHR